MASGTRVLGRQKLREAFKKLSQNVRTDLQEQMNAAGAQIVDLAKSRVGVETGALRDSIKSIPFTKGGIGVLVVAGGKATTKPVRNGAKAEYDYSRAQELGTQEMLAQPFFYPSYRQLRAKVRRNMTKVIKKAIVDAGFLPTSGK